MVGNSVSNENNKDNEEKVEATIHDKFFCNFYPKQNKLIVQRIWAWSDKSSHEYDAWMFGYDDHEVFVIRIDNTSLYLMEVVKIHDGKRRIEHNNCVQQILEGWKEIKQTESGLNICYEDSKNNIHYEIKDLMRTNLKEFMAKYHVKTVSTVYWEPYEKGKPLTVNIWSDELHSNDHIFNNETNRDIKTENNVVANYFLNSKTMEVVGMRDRVTYQRVREGEHNNMIYRAWLCDIPDREFFVIAQHKELTIVTIGSNPIILLTDEFPHFLENIQIKTNDKGFDIEGSYFNVSGFESFKQTYMVV